MQGPIIYFFLICRSSFFQILIFNAIIYCMLNISNWEHLNNRTCYRDPDQSFQVEGPQNKEISLIIENTIGRFLREFSRRNQSATAAIM